MKKVFNFFLKGSDHPNCLWDKLSPFAKILAIFFIGLWCTPAILLGIKLISQ